MPVACACKDLRWALPVALPIGHATKRGAYCAQIISPDFLSCLGFERYHAVVDSRRVQDAADHDGHGFCCRRRPGCWVGVNGAGVDAILPGQSELRHILGVNLFERGKALASLIIAVRGPVSLTVESRHEDRGEIDDYKDSHRVLPMGSVKGGGVAEREGAKQVGSLLFS